MDRGAGKERISQLLRQHGIRLKKSLGQNFLTDPRVVERIVEAAALHPTDGVLEIGPGVGVLTKALARKAKRVVAVEIDQRLIPILVELFKEDEHIEVIHGDILKVDLQSILSSLSGETERIHVVTNLPYYVTTPILMHLLESKFPLSSIVVMVQKEVAERIAAKPGSKAYGALSVACQYYAEIKIVSEVPRTLFFPEPEVDSAVVRFRLYASPPVRVIDEALFFRVVRTLFAKRRKTIFNNLRAGFPEMDGEWLSILKGAGIEATRRGETLTLQEFAFLTNHIGDALERDNQER